MTSTTTDKHPARAELLRHADRIESGELEWVPFVPRERGTCCAGWWIEIDAQPPLPRLKQLDPLVPIGLGVEGTRLRRRT